MAYPAITNLSLRLPSRKITSFCQRWKITELALFGSVLRTDFNPESDIDILVSFTEDAEWSLFDLLQMQQELEDIFSRPVDLVERDTIRNPFRMRSILENNRVIYAAH